MPPLHEIAHPAHVELSTRRSGPAPTGEAGDPAFLPAREDDRARDDDQTATAGPVSVATDPAERNPLGVEQ